MRLRLTIERGDPSVLARKLARAPASARGFDCRRCGDVVLGGAICAACGARRLPPGLAYAAVGGVIFVAGGALTAISYGAAGPGGRHSIDWLPLAIGLALAAYGVIVLATDRQVP